jgi:hypothetical protein
MEEKDKKINNQKIQEKPKGDGKHIAEKNINF